MPRKLSQSEFVYRARQKHGGKYEYGEYNGRFRKMWICCKEHEWFEQKPNEHLTGNIGCPRCANKHVTQVEFIAKARSVHSDRYEYGTYVRAMVPMWICCKEHGWFEQRPNDHLSGYGCLYCAGKGVTTDTYIEKARAIHGNMYEYGEYTPSVACIWICCKEHGWFEQKPSSHLMGSGCSQCAGNSPLTQCDYESRVRAIHGDLYEYGTFVGTMRNIWICCKEHGWFEQNAGKHLIGYGCPRCTTNRYSKKSIMWLDLCSHTGGIEIQHAENNSEFKIDGIGLVDGYCEETNTVYEFHGDYWHGHPSKYSSPDTHPISKKLYGELYQKTLERDQKIKDLGYNLVVIWEHEWDKTEKENKKLMKLQNAI